MTRPVPDLADEFVALNQYLYTVGDRDSVLQKLVRLAVGAVPGCDWAAITAWHRSDGPYSLACSADVASAADQLQYDLRKGPCLAAAEDAEVVWVADLASDSRWPAFSAAAQRSTPVRGVLSFHLADTPQRSALNMYSGTPGAFDDEAVTLAALVAAHARVLLSHAASADRAANLEIALATSRQIGAAVGILMHAHRISDEEAFDLLRASSQELHRKLRDVAGDVMSTGALPDPDPTTTRAHRGHR